jgi:hypothetical protein
MSSTRKATARLRTKSLLAVAGMCGLIVPGAVTGGSASAQAALAGQIQHWGAYIGGINPFGPAEASPMTARAMSATDPYCAVSLRSAAWTAVVSVLFVSRSRK